MRRRRSILASGAVLSLIAVGLLVLSGYGANDAYDWDVARCGRALVDWYPEWLWLLFVGPLALFGLIAGLATIGMEYSRRGGWASWLGLGLCALLVVAAGFFAWSGLHGPCPPVS